MKSLFVISGQYIAPMEEVDRVLPAHRVFLDKHYVSGAFMCSGPMNPRTGGVIICCADSREHVEEIMREDPFQTERISDYSIVEFTPTKGCAEVERFIAK